MIRLVVTLLLALASTGAFAAVECKNPFDPNRGTCDSFKPQAQFEASDWFRMSQAYFTQWSSYCKGRGVAQVDSYRCRQVTYVESRCPAVTMKTEPDWRILCDRWGIKAAESAGVTPEDAAKVIKGLFSKAMESIQETPDADFGKVKQYTVRVPGGTGNRTLRVSMSPTAKTIVLNAVVQQAGEMLQDKVLGEECASNVRLMVAEMQGKIGPSEVIDAAVAVGQGVSAVLGAKPLLKAQNCAMYEVSDKYHPGADGQRAKEALAECRANAALVHEAQFGLGRVLAESVIASAKANYGSCAMASK